MFVCVNVLKQRRRQADNVSVTPSADKCHLRTLNMFEMGMDNGIMLEGKTGKRN